MEVLRKMYTCYFLKIYKMNETLVRSLSGIVYVFLLIFATLFSKESFLILFGLFLLQTVSEFSKLIKLPLIASLLVSAFVFVLFALFLGTNEYYNDLLVLTISLLTSAKLLFWLFEKENHKIQSIVTKWLYLIGYVVFSFVLMVKLIIITKSSDSENNLLSFSFYLPEVLISIFILIWTNDTFAYLTGKTFGKHKLFERISPKKTIEGFVGGMLFAMLAGVLISKFYVPGLAIWKWIVIAFIVSVFGTLGDLVESKFKRIAGVKDSGTIMPGHGGVYDRLDSVIFVVPFVFLFFKILEYVS